MEDIAGENAVLDAVSRIGQAAAVGTDLQALLELVYRESSRIVQADCFGLGLYDPQAPGLRFELVYDRGVLLPTVFLRRAEGWGLAGRVLEERRPLLLESPAESDLLTRVFPSGKVPHSWLGVPLLVGERAIGVLLLQHDARSYEPADQHLLEVIASHAAVAVENLLLRQEHERRITELSALTEIGQAILGATRMEDLLEVIYRETSKVMATDNLYIALYHPEEEEITFDFFLEDGERASTEPVHLDNGGATVHIVTTRQPLLLGGDMEQAMAERGIALIGRPAMSYLGVPMLARDQVVGVLSVQDPSRPGAYSRRHQDLLSNIANLAAVAIQNLRLYELAQTRAAQAAALNEIARAVNANLDLQTILGTVADEVARLVHHDRASLALPVENDPDHLRLWLMKGAPDSELGSGTLFPVEGSMVGWAYQNGRPFVAPDLAEKQYVPGDTPLLREGIRSYVCVPLLQGGQAVGTLNLGSSQPRAFGDHNVPILEQICAQLAIAVRNARLFEISQRRVAETDTLNEIGRALSSAVELDEVLETIYQQTGRIFDTSSFYIATHEEGSDEWGLALDVEHGERLPPARHKLGAGLTGYIIRNREPLLFRFAKEIVAFRQAEGVPAVGNPALSWMGVPLIAAGTLVGVMAIQSYEQENLYGEQDLALFSTIAAQAAIAMYNARLYQDARRRAEEMETLFAVGRILSASLEPEETWKAVFMAVHQVVPYDGIEACLYDEQRGALRAVMSGTPEETSLPQEELYRPGEGFTGWIAETRRPLLVADVHQEMEVQPVHKQFGGRDLRSYLGVPMILGEQLIGTLEITRFEVGAYDSHQADLLMSVATQAASAVERARLFEQARVRAEELAALNELGLALTARLNVDEVLREAYRQASRLVDTTNFYIGLYDPEKDQISIRFDVTHSKLDEQIRVIPADQGFTGHMVRNRTSVLFKDHVEEGYAAMGIQVVGEVAKSWLGVPLLVGDRVLGAMAVQSFTTPGLYDEHARDLLTAIANQVAIAIDNARLFEETQRALQEVREASEQQQLLLDTVRELSTPLVPLSDQVLVLPLVGTVDSRRAQQIMEVLLGGVAERRARVVILDITGVPVVDTNVANYLLQATQALRLVGAECVLVGITPEVAQTVVELGVDLRTLVTRSDLQGGIEYAQRLLKRRFVD